MCIKCAPPLADLFLYLYEVNFTKGILKNQRKEARHVIQIALYTWNSLNICKLGDIVDCISPIKLEIKDTTDTARSATLLDLLLEIDSEARLRMKLYDKMDNLNFPIVSFPFLFRNVPSAYVYAVYIYHSTQIPVDVSHQDFTDRGLMLKSKLQNNGY
jgi:hypothetical protein